MAVINLSGAGCTRRKWADQWGGVLLSRLFQNKIRVPERGRRHLIEHAGVLQGVQQHRMAVGLGTQLLWDCGGTATAPVLWQRINDSTAQHTAVMSRVRFLAIKHKCGPCSIFKYCDVPGASPHATLTCSADIMCTFGSRVHPS